jgi:nucleotide-binding universal stress UspA family protein
VQVKTYVVGTDGSATATRATERAAELAAATGAAVHVVCAYERRGYETMGSGTDQLAFSGLNEAEDTANAQAATFRSHGINATFAAIADKPADALIAEAERLEAELIVVGNRRMQGLGRLLGSVASHVAHNAPCDVLVVKTV